MLALPGRQEGQLGQALPCVKTPTSHLRGLTGSTVLALELGSRGSRCVRALCGLSMSLAGHRGAPGPMISLWGDAVCQGAGRHGVLVPRPEMGMGAQVCMPMSGRSGQGKVPPSRPSPLARLEAKGTLGKTLLCSLPDGRPAPGPLSAVSPTQLLLLSSCRDGDNQNCKVTPCTGDSHPHPF